MGSAIAIVFYFRNDLVLIINSFTGLIIKRNLINDDNSRLLTYLIVASIPILVVGLVIKLFWHDFSTSFFRGFNSIAIVSIVMAILLAIAEKYFSGKKLFKDIKLRDIILLGLSQALAIFPGVSRSGVTLTSALFSGIERKTAARLSFLVGIPAISISGFVELFSLFYTSSLIDFFPIIIGIISSFFSSIIAIDFLLKFLAKYNTLIFVYYRLAFGVVIFTTLYF